MDTLPQQMIFIMKPIVGCNLSCKYCYMDSDSVNHVEIMSEMILEKTIKEIGKLQLEKVEFCWHGGEPLLVGINFYKIAKKLQKKYIGNGTKIKNSIQTNGTLITEEWAKFLTDYDFGVGVSLDGPQKINDYNRSFTSGKGSYLSVMRGIEVLQKNDFDIYVIPVVTEFVKNNAKELFDFFVGHGIYNFAFTPCYKKGKTFRKQHDNNPKNVICPDSFGKFMTDIYDLWMESNNPDISIRYLKQILKIILGGKSNLCIFMKGNLCYQFLTINSNGNVHPCDSYMSEKLFFGNIKCNSLREIMNNCTYKIFRENVVQIPEVCKTCSIYEICGGGCSFFRYLSIEKFDNLSYYCDSTKMIVDHISKHLFNHSIVS
jgi:uncharacterized protein